MLGDPSHSICLRLLTYGVPLPDEWMALLNATGEQSGSVPEDRQNFSSDRRKKTRGKGLRPTTFFGGGGIPVIRSMLSLKPIVEF
jgi:hypothetical protein